MPAGGRPASGAGFLLPHHALRGATGALLDEPGVRTDPVLLKGGHVLAWHPGGQVSAMALRGHHLCSVVNLPFLDSHHLRAACSPGHLCISPHFYVPTLGA